MSKDFKQKKNKWKNLLVKKSFGPKKALVIWVLKKEVSAEKIDRKTFWSNIIFENVFDDDESKVECSTAGA